MTFFLLPSFLQDGRLSAKEFVVGFHLIVCKGKKGLTLPPQLPPELVNFLMHAPAVPVVPAQAPSPVAVPPTAPSPVLAPMPAPKAE